MHNRWVVFQEKYWVKLIIQGRLFFFCGEISSLGEDFFHFSLVPNMFPSSFHQVPNMFPRFPSVFPIAPHFNPICFAQSPPLLTYIAGPKGMALHPSVESFYFGEPPQIQLPFAVGQSNPLVTDHSFWNNMRYLKKEKNTFGTPKVKK